MYNGHRNKQSLYLKYLWYLYANTQNDIVSNKLPVRIGDRHFWFGRLLLAEHIRLISKRFMDAPMDGHMLRSLQCTLWDTQPFTYLKKIYDSSSKMKLLKNNSLFSNRNTIVEFLNNKHDLVLWNIQDVLRRVFTRHCEKISQFWKMKITIRDIFIKNTFISVTFLNGNCHKFFLLIFFFIPFAYFWYLY